MSVVLVTGASSGIGAATAIEFAEAGWDVMAAGRDEVRLEEVADVADSIATWAGDLVDSEDCDELIADTIDEFGQLDCLVNAAGVLIRGSIDELGDDDWRDTLGINLDIPFFLSRAALPHLLETAGSIANIASLRGLRSGAGIAAYCASKGGLIMLTRAIARDHAAEGVRANAICPGDVDTPMLALGAEYAGLDVSEYLTLAADASPNGRIATPEDVARLVVFLASDAARHVNGAVLSIDGGLTA